MYVLSHGFWSWSIRAELRGASVAGSHPRLQSRWPPRLPPRLWPSHSHCWWAPCSSSLLAGDISPLSHGPLCGVPLNTAAWLTQTEVCRRKWERESSKVEVKVCGTLISEVMTHHYFVLFCLLGAIKSSWHSKGEGSIRSETLAGTVRALTQHASFSRGKQHSDPAFFPDSVPNNPGRARSLL